MPDLVTRGREAIKSHAWDEARDALSAADSDGGLAPDDLVRLGDAFWWSGQPDEALDVFERAYGGFVADDRIPEAASTAALLAYLAMRRLKTSVGAGWMARAEHLLDDQPESIGHAWLNLLRTAVALMMESDFEGAIRLADQTIDVAKRHGGPGVQSMAMSFKGYAMIERGEWQDGLRIVDEAAVVANSQDVDLRATSDVYCNTIAVCRSLADYRRAGEWTEEAERWMLSHSVGGYPGVCQVHRAELKRLRGSWPEAEREARKACTELERFHLVDAIGFAHYEIGEVRRRMGDFDAAERAFMEAYEHGHLAQPGYALLLKEQGKIEDATRAITSALDSLPGDHPLAGAMTRGRLLPARVEIALAAGDLDTARAASTQLEEISTLFEGAAWRATALTCRGSVLLHDEQPEAAIESLSEAWRLWHDIELPYEAAQARTLLGRARLAAGDEAGAMLEFRSARSAVEQLGAAADLRTLDQIGATAGTDADTRRRVTRTFLFTDIVTSTDLIALIGDAAWESLLAWHDRVLRQEIESTGGEVVRHTGDGYFASFGEARAAIETAVAIQRRLSSHRQEHGFAPWVRIGMHVAEATRQGPDYAGQGVHAAARVGALAEREEILASADTITAAGAIPFPVGDARTAELKGIAEPIEVHAIDWR
jgi:class 3 adenylate cyclase